MRAEAQTRLIEKGERRFALASVGFLECMFYIEMIDRHGDVVDAISWEDHAGTMASREIAEFLNVHPDAVEKIVQSGHLLCAQGADQRINLMDLWNFLVRHPRWAFFNHTEWDPKVVTA